MKVLCVRQSVSVSTTPGVVDTLNGLTRTHRTFIFHLCFYRLSQAKIKEYLKNQRLKDLDKSIHRWFWVKMNGPSVPSNYTI